jgi:DNA polymerase IV
MQRNIVHMDLDTFFVSVERLQNARLKERPVIIGGLSDRGVVAGCSYETRQFGVHSGMPMKMARTLCADAIIIRGDMDSYSKYSRLVTDVIAEAAPVYEKASIDEHYIDLTGMERFFGTQKWAHELRLKIIKETGLPISLGLSINKTVSKMATSEAKPNGERVVVEQKIHDFMDPLSISKIPMLGQQTAQKLMRMGVFNIRTLREMPPEMLESVFGKNGYHLWKKANGVDNTPIIQYTENKSISSETTFEIDTTDVEMLRGIIISMVEKIAYQLRKKQKLTGVVTIKIRYSNFDTHTIQKRLHYTSFDHILIQTALELFDKLYSRRILIRLIGVKFSELIGGVQQLNMFEDSAEMVNLYQAMDNIRHRFGQKAVRRAIIG